MWEHNLNEIKKGEITLPLPSAVVGWEYYNNIINYQYSSRHRDRQMCELTNNSNKKIHT